MPKILIVDDSRSTRDLVRECLESFGFTNILEADNGREALTLFEQNVEIGFIITDCHMPIVDGYMMAETLHQMKEGKTPPILVLTTESNVGVKEKFKRLGVVGWVIKPFDKAKMGPVLANLIRKLCAQKSSETAK